MQYRDIVVSQFRASIQNFFITFTATILFLLEGYICCAHRDDFCEDVIVFSFQLILFANTAPFLLFSAWISFTMFENASAVGKLPEYGAASKRRNTLATLGLF